MPDTIVALATPTGRSGIGVIRLSGADSLTIARQSPAKTTISFEPRLLALLKLREHATGE